MSEPILQPLLHALDPVSLILSSQSDHPMPLKLTTTTDTFFYALERGPRYREYAELRESKLRLKSFSKQEEDKDCDFKQTPPKKQVKFQACNMGSRKGGSFNNVLAQSVPDFSATLRKENRKPPPCQELTPPGSGSKYSSKVSGGMVSGGSRGSKSANSGGEKKGRNGNLGGGGGGLVGRKSYASLEELRGLGLAASSAINGENRGGKGGIFSRGVGYGKNILGYRQF